MRGALVTILLRVLSLAAMMISSIVIARLLGPAQFGSYSFVLSIVAMASLPVQMGIPTLVMRETAAGAALENWARVRGVWYWSGRAAIVTSTLTLAVLTGALVIIGIAKGGLESGAIFYSALPLVPLLGLAEIRGSALNGLKRIVAGTLPDKILRPLGLAVALIGISMLMPIPVTATTAMMTHSVIALLTFLLGGWLLLRARPAAMVSATGLETDGPAWIRTILPIALIGGLQTISHNVDLLMLGLFRSDEEVGVYKVALSASNLTIFGLTALSFYVQPYIVHFHATGDWRKLQRATSMGATGALMLALPLVLVFCLFPAGILSFLFGDAFAAGASPLVILVLAQLGNAAFGFTGMLLPVLGLEKYALYAFVISTSLNIAGNLILIPAYGTVGAAIATGFSVLVWNFACWIVIYRKLNIDATVFGFLNHRPGWLK